MVPRLTIAVSWRFYGNTVCRLRHWLHMSPGGSNLPRPEIPLRRSGTLLSALWPSNDNRIPLLEKINLFVVDAVVRLVKLSAFGWHHTFGVIMLLGRAWTLIRLARFSVKEIRNKPFLFLRQTKRGSKGWQWKRKNIQTVLERQSPRI